MRQNTSGREATGFWRGSLANYEIFYIKIDVWLYSAIIFLIRPLSESDTYRLPASSIDK